MRRSSTAALSILATQPCLSVPRPSKMNEISEVADLHASPPRSLNALVHDPVQTCWQQEICFIQQNITE